MASKMKMQTTQFRTVEDLLDYLPHGQLEIVQVLRRLVFAALPHAEEKLSYQVPYYFGRSRICFIWPGSVPWGNSTFEGVQLGFCKGYLLDDQAGYLEKRNRKQVYIKTFQHLSEIDVDLVRGYLWEAAEVDKGRPS